MTPETRKRIGLLLIIALFLAPVVTAYVLNALGWRPAGFSRNSEISMSPK